jgi:hypothetical protein
MPHTTIPLPTCSGFCTRCQSLHTLPMAGAKIAALELIKQLDRDKRLDGHVPPEKSDPRFSTDYLFGKARGKMFGILVCQRADGSILTLKSFSGQYNGACKITGWVPPLFDLQQWHKVNDAAEKEIKNMGVTINALAPASPRARELVRQRKKQSQALMKKIHQLYTLYNFRSQCRPLLEAYTGQAGIPNGTADCCGPKLLNFAARNNLLPLGIAEFYYGRQSKQGSRIHGNFYPSCQDKCAPILGYMLCGLSR